MSGKLTVTKGDHAEHVDVKKQTRALINFAVGLLAEVGKLVTDVSSPVGVISSMRNLVIVQVFADA